MSLFVLYALDRRDSLALRQELRPRHLDWIDAQGTNVRLAGPLLDAAGKPEGSMLILEADTLAQAEKIAAGDPYARHDLFAQMTITPWRDVVNRFG